MDADRAFRYPTTEVNTPVTRAVITGHAFGSDSLTVFIQAEASPDVRFVCEGTFDYQAPGPVFPVAPPEPSEEERAFAKEKLAFETLNLGELRVYQGQYVAVHGERIVDADRDLHALTDRFFSRFGDTTVFISFVGSKPREHLPSPIL